MAEKFPEVLAEDKSSSFMLVDKNVDRPSQFDPKDGTQIKNFREYRYR